MKLLSIVLIVAAIFVAGSDGGSPSEPKVCDVVLKIIYEFSDFTSTLLRMYVLNSPRSDDSSLEVKERKLDGLVDLVVNNEQVLAEEKEAVFKLCQRTGNIDERAWYDQLTRAHIWDCFVEIFHSGIHLI